MPFCKIKNSVARKLFSAFIYVLTIILFIAIFSFITFLLLREIGLPLIVLIFINIIGIVKVVKRIRLKKRSDKVEELL